MKIGMKLVVIISIFNIIGIGVLAGVTLFQSRREISRLTEEEAKTIAEKTGGQMGTYFETYMGAARTLAQIMEGYKKIPAEQRRDQFSLMLSQVAAANYGMSPWTTWGPNLLDGMDDRYVNTLGTDASGRYNAIWYNIPDGSVLGNLDREGWDELMEQRNLTEYMLDPFVYIVTGENYEPTSILTTSIGVPIKDSGVIVGYVGFGFDISIIQTMVGDIKPFGDGHVMLFSSGGIVAAHSDPERLGKNMRESERDTFGPFLDGMVEAVTQGEPLSFSYQPQGSGAIMQYYAAPFLIGNSPKPWTVVVGVSRDTVMVPVYRMMAICLVIGVLTIILLSVGVILTARSISRPIAHTMTVLKDIAEGDLTKKIAIHSRDELGELAHHLNFTVDKIKNLVVSIKSEAGSLSQSGTELAEHILNLTHKIT
jgi:methyl-accepting chemotaxis protein